MNKSMKPGAAAQRALTEEEMKSQIMILKNPKGEMMGLYKSLYTC